MRIRAKQRTNDVEEATTDMSKALHKTEKGRGSNKRTEQSQNSESSTPPGKGDSSGHYSKRSNQHIQRDTKKEESKIVRYMVESARERPASRNTEKNNIYSREN